ncbi:hypothetical protein [Clostridium brassicae]|uniref:Uncharacterized protein n=1 Tax=Clostridium brassicae TaxID=2999072 RepID=A0ABT4DAL4_9CLOT|nr:hypothetical protein [Clostridium brassicae]MCY6959337.1 hypothetical protein [Clostridium brassicae]
MLLVKILTTLIRDLHYLGSCECFICKSLRVIKWKALINVVLGQFIVYTLDILLNNSI